ncbi:hypothetical protein Rleg_5736 (plasmid) [Rhizobium leguminosarum bv. trifolii WSM1325]|jgi:hypothetical protein|uniref:Uncharacterized protein n=1 Tax=Rhizobium leguminosarum bv. trifolii (strain WSM1325) TaxID=395491 RepID=C6B9E3_RHILS|nr:hypothetical protein Rleg_5736 [Rhizobium leguminosarum bv. trifolii WSM1325]
MTSRWDDSHLAHNRTDPLGGIPHVMQSGSAGRLSSLSTGLAAKEI